MWYTPENSEKRVDINSLNNDEILSIYAKMIDSTAEVQMKQYEIEIEQQLLKKVTSQNPDLSPEEYEVLLNAEIEGLSEREADSIIKDNLMGKIRTLVQEIALMDLELKASDGTAEFPLKEEIAIKGLISANIEASKMHDRRYYLGTDYQGRDMLSRIIYGGQVSIAIGFVGTITSVLIGIVLGALAGYLGGKVDYFIMRIVDIMYGLPYMLLVIIAMAIFGRNILNLFFALAIISWLTVSRMVRRANNEP